MHLIIIAMRSHLCYLNITSAITANTPQAVLSAVIINFFYTFSQPSASTFSHQRLSKRQKQTNSNKVALRRLT